MLRVCQQLVFAAVFAAALLIPQHTSRRQMLGDAKPVRLPTVVVFDDARENETPILLPEADFDRAFAQVRAQRAAARAAARP